MPGYLWIRLVGTREDAYSSAELTWVTNSQFLSWSSSKASFYRYLTYTIMVLWWNLMIFWLVFPRFNCEFTLHNSEGPFFPPIRISAHRRKSWDGYYGISTIALSFWNRYNTCTTQCFATDGVNSCFLAYLVCSLLIVVPFCLPVAQAPRLHSTIQIPD